MKSIFAASIAAAFLLLAPNAHATGYLTCESGAQSTWKTQEELTQKIKSEGWKVRRIKIDGGCYEVYGTTPEGDRVEAYFDPKSLEKLLVHRRGTVLFRKGS